MCEFKRVCVFLFRSSCSTISEERKRGKRRELGKRFLTRVLSLQQTQNWHIWHHACVSSFFFLFFFFSFLAQKNEKEEERHRKTYYSLKYIYMDIWI